MSAIHRIGLQDAGVSRRLKVEFVLDRHNEKEGKKIMKKQIILLLFLTFGILTAVSVVMADLTPGSGIMATSHDLSSATGHGAAYNAGLLADAPLDRICIYCHAPHHTITTAQAAANGITYYPLWNHDVTLVTTWTTYQNTDPANPVIPDDIQHQLSAELGDPASVSKLCLSCHDGTVAISSYGNFDGSSSHHTGNINATGRILIGSGGNLQNHHPIGFNYDDVAAADDEIKSPTTALMGTNPFGLTIEDLLWNRSIECSSCHDVHNTKNTGLKFLRVEDTNSNLCFSCHRK